MADLQTEGTLQRLRGKIRSIWGDLTDDDIDRAHGSLDMLIGTIKQKSGGAEDAIRRRLDSLMAGKDTHDVEGEAEETQRR